MPKQKPIKLLVAAFFISAASFFLLSGTSRAATINVSTNDVASTNNSDCTLREAIENINTQSNAVNTDCAAGDGINDTVIVPLGTITVTADLPQITTSIVIQGAGMGESVISGNAGANGLFSNQPAATDKLVVSGLTLRSYHFFALLSLQGNVELNQVEVDGTGAVFDSGPGSFSGAFAIQNPTASDISVDMNDVYVHGLQADSQTMFAIIVMGGGNTAPAENINFTANNITIADLTNTGAVVSLASGFGILNAGAGGGNTTAVLSNVTIANIVSTADSAVGVVAMTLGQDKSSTVLLRNATITNIQGTSTNFVSGGGIASISAGGQPGFGSASRMTISNVVVYDTPLNCGLGDLSSITGGDPGVNSITSTGGNLSDDNSCASYFSAPTDQNNVAGLGASLAALADNGGFVPTMALKEGSPAIDSGITIAGLTTDARLASRPQGSAYDSGAYESPYSKPATPTLAKSGQGITFLVPVAASVLSLGYIVNKRRYVFKQLR